jgi:hypothetical protein
MKTYSKRFGCYYLGFLLLILLVVVGLFLTVILENWYWLIPLVLLISYMIIGFNKKFVKWLKK